MDYKLAKELKDAGFKFRRHQLPANELVGIEVDNELLPIPTLSELIEACGEDIEGLHRIDVYWYAYSIPHIDKRVEGKRPEEAVARLWLELNK